MLYIANISETFQDFPDNESLAVIVFFKGCSHHCPNCQNSNLQNRTGESLRKEEVLNLIKYRCSRSNTNKIVLSGGDPFYEENRKDVMYIITVLENDGYEVCAYTGYSLDDIETFYILNPAICSYPTYLKCGRYEENLKEETWGKTDNNFKLVTTNQKFYKWIDGKYKQISSDNILYFS